MDRDVPGRRRGQEVRLYLDDGKLFYQRGANRLRVVPLIDGRFLILGSPGVHLEEVPGEPGRTRLQLVRGGEVLRVLERTGSDTEADAQEGG